MAIAAWLGTLLLAAAQPPAGEAGAAAPAVNHVPAVAGLEGVDADLQAGRFAAARQRIERVLRGRLPGPVVRDLQKLRGEILLSEDQRDQAMAAFAAAEAVAPRDPAVALYELDLAYGRGDPLLAVAAVDHLIERFPEAARMAEPTRIVPLITWLRQNQRARDADTLLIRLAGIGFGGDNLATRDNFAIEAAAGAAAAGRLDEARALARRVHSRQELTMALTERRFSALWPDIEAQVGPHMAAAEATAISEAEATAARHPDSVAARHGLMKAYYLAGRYAGADRVGAAFAATSAAMGAIDEAGGWLVNDHALVLYAMGRGDAADARFAAMRVIDIAQHGWLISMVINRLELLVRDHRWDRALPLLDDAAALSEVYGSPYARQLTRRLKLCTLHALGHDDEAEALLAVLRAHETESPGSLIDALICLGRVDEAEPVLVRWLGRTGEAGAAIDSLQPAGAGRSSDPSIWTQGWEQLRERPAVRQALAAVGRTLPEAYWPRPAAE